MNPREMGSSVARALTAVGGDAAEAGLLRWLLALPSSELAEAAAGVREALRIVQDAESAPPADRPTTLPDRLRAAAQLADVLGGVDVSSVTVGRYYEHTADIEVQLLGRMDDATRLRTAMAVPFTDDPSRLRGQIYHCWTGTWQGLRVRVAAHEPDREDEPVAVQYGDIPQPVTAEGGEPG